MIYKTLVTISLVLTLSSVPVKALEVQLVKGVNVDAWLAADPTVPVVAIAFRIEGGAAADPPELQGRTRLLADMLSEGAGEMDGPTFKARLADLSSSMSFTATQDAISGSIYTLSKNLREAAKILGLALTNPRLDPADLERVRTSHVTSLEQASQNPTHQAYRAFLSNAFQNHPYARSSRGRISTLKKITREDLLALHEERFGQDRLIVTAAGDVTANELKNIIDYAFGEIPKNAPGAPTDPPSVSSPQGPSRLLVKMPNPQSSIVFGGSGVRRNDPDWHATNLLAEIMGGSFGARLMEEVRVKRGLVYGIDVSNSELAEAALFLGSTSTENRTVKETISVIETEWAKMSAEGPTEKELADAKSFLIGSLPLALDSTTAIASALLSMRVNNLPTDYLERRNSQINSVTIADAKRVASRLFDPSKLTFAVAGSGEGLEQWNAVPRSDN